MSSPFAHVSRVIRGACRALIMDGDSPTKESKGDENQSPLESKNLSQLKDECKSRVAQVKMYRSPLKEQQISAMLCQDDDDDEDSRSASPMFDKLEEPAKFVYVEKDEDALLRNKRPLDDSLEDFKPVSAKKRRRQGGLTDVIKANQKDSEGTRGTSKKSIPSKEVNGTPSKRTSKREEVNGTTSNETSESEKVKGTPSKRTARSEKVNGTTSKETSEGEEENGTPSKRTARRVEMNGTPSRKTSRKVEKTGTPSKETAKADDENGTPSKRTSRRVEKNDTPSKGTLIVDNEKGTPSRRTSRRVEVNGTPSRRTSRRVESTETPSKETFNVDDDIATPSKRTSRRVETNGTPSRRTSRRVESTTGTPSKETFKGDDEIGTPSRRTSRHVETNRTPSRRTSRRVERTGTPSKVTSKLDDDEIGTPSKRTSSRRVQKTNGTPLKETSKIDDENETPPKRPTRHVEINGTPSKVTSECAATNGTPSKRTSRRVETTGTPSKAAFRNEEENGTPSRRTSRRVEMNGTPSKRTSRHVDTTGTPSNETSEVDDEFGTPSRRTSRRVETNDTPSKRTSKKNTPAKGKLKLDDDDWTPNLHEEDVWTPTKKGGTPRKRAGTKGTPLRKTPKCRRVMQPGMPLRAIPLTDNHSNLEEAQLRLHVSAVPDSLPCREEEFSEVLSFTEGKIMDGSGGCMYISGVPGTGKTATVKEVMRTLNQSVDEGDLPQFDFIEINGMRLTEPSQAYVQLWKALKGVKVTAEHAKNLLERHFTSGSATHRTTVVLVDELDLLWNRKQSVLYNIFEWPTNKSAKLVVLAIANTMDLPERVMINRVSSRIGLTRLTFSPYTHDQLREIVTTRLSGLSVFDKDAIQLVARKVASLSGDARRALDICRRAAEIAQYQGGNQLVGLAHVAEAHKEMFCSPKIMAIRCCSRYEKMFMQSMASVFHKTGIEEATFERTYLNMKEGLQFENMYILSTEEAYCLVGRLTASRLLLTEPGKSGRLDMKLRLNVSQEDVCFALKDS